MFLIEVLKKYFGINNFDSSLAENLPIEVFLALSILLLSVISLSCIVNIFFYFIVLFAFDSKYIKDKMEKWNILKRVINFYRNTRIFFIIFEFSLFIFVNWVIISSCYKIVSAYYFKS